MSTKKHVLPATIASRFGITEDELLQSRRRGLFPGNQGYTIVDGGRLRLVFPADLRPPAEDDTAVTEPDAEAEPEPEEGDA
jgi:hypothetical protein